MIVADLQGIYNELYNDVGRYQVNVGVQLGTLLQIQAQFGLDLFHLQLLLLRNHFLLQILLLRNLLLLHWGSFHGGRPCIRDCSRRGNRPGGVSLHPRNLHSLHLRRSP